MSTRYTSDFFESRGSAARLSALEIVPLLMDLIRPCRVVDVGCATGEWLAVFREHGVSDCLGIDGNWLDQTQLKIPIECFQFQDLASPIVTDQLYDLALCLEVGEHLPPQSAETLVASLTALSPVILFSAAVPKQGGNVHLNEQWPEFWNAIFHRKGYTVIDCIRRRVWTNPKVSWWYAQNTFLYVATPFLEKNLNLLEESRRIVPEQLSLIHPKLYLKKCAGHDKYKSTLKHKLIVRMLSVFPGLPRSLQRQLSPLKGYLDKQRQFALTDVTWPFDSESTTHQTNDEP